MKVTGGVYGIILFAAAMGMALERSSFLENVGAHAAGVNVAAAR
jgi:hypothetical protein